MIIIISLSCIKNLSIIVISLRDYPFIKNINIKNVRVIFTCNVKERCNYRFLGKTSTTDTNNMIKFLQDNSPAMVATKTGE